MLNYLKLVYYEECNDVREAIIREKQIKGWRRQKKNELVETLNPNWDDLINNFLFFTDKYKDKLDNDETKNPLMYMIFVSNGN